VRSIILALACFAGSLLAIPAGAAVLRPLPGDARPASAIRPLTFAATRGALAGTMAPGQSVSILVHLPGMHENELDAFLATLSASANPRYLTPEEFGRYFGAEPSAYARAIAALRAAGFVIDDLAANRTDIVAHAPALRVEAFFATPLDVRIERGRTFFTARYEPQVPAALAGATITGLDDYLQFHPIGLHRRSPGGAVSGSWQPADLAVGYDLAPLYARGFDGKGVTIANATSGAASASDLATFQQNFGLPLVPLQSYPVGGPLSPSCGQGCGNSESSLDADSATSIAREATFLQVVAHTPSNHNFDLAYAYIVNNLGKTVHVVTTSWGICERDIKKSKSFDYDEGLFKQAAAEGQFWFSASGDNGTDDCNDGGHAVSVDFPGSSPHVVSVGGTNVQGSVNSSGRVTGWAGETTWQYSNSDGASGGGKSIAFPKPKYQNGVTPPDGRRDVPDVSLIADPQNDGVYLCQNGQVQPGWGGTSEAAPMWAGFLAVVQQMHGGKRLADPHARLYKLGQAHAGFHDILTGNNGVPRGRDPYYPSLAFPGYNARAGFDLATGWGSFDAAVLANAY
jgi:subtilase family serine protease